ncbi:MAG: hypothetical protein C0403_14675 [Desulfobacterium sp.]|nr:hypothetical protein [Desulfobacterium sp.]
MISKIIVNNKIIFLYSLLGILFFSWPAEAVREKMETGVKANLSTSEKTVVDTLVAEYFNFLFSGDMIGLKKISSGELFSQIERLDTNPGYSEFLRKQYLNAEYEIIDYRMNSKKKLMVTVRVTKGDGPGSGLLIYIDRNSGNMGSGQQMKIENAEKQ